MSKYKTSKITNCGQELLLNCIANKAELQFTRIAFGSGEYSSDSNIVAQTALKNEKQSVSISTMSVKSNHSVEISAILSNQELTTGYRITEVGLFAKDKLDASAQEILYAICIAEDGYADYFPEYNGYAPTKLLQDFYIDVADASSTTILVDDSVGASKAYIDEFYYTKEESKLRFGLAESVTFDENYVPLTTSSDTSLSTGKFAAGNTSIKYVYIPSSVTSVSSGTFYGCTNLTDIYVDNTEDNIIFHTPNHIPSTAKIHYLDNFNANGYIIKALLNLVKTGSGNLNDDSLLSIRYASYTYQQIGNVVTLEVHTYINPNQTIGNLRFNNIPVETQNQYTGICISSTNALYKWTIENSTLEISKLDASQWIHDNGEEFRFVVTYEV